jgi:iron complex outermembrane receptor protein
MTPLQQLRLPYPRHALAIAACLVLAPWAHAQQAAAPPAPAASAPTTTLQPVVVTGNPLGSGEIAAPVSVLSGEQLMLRRGSSIGETINGLPGVSSTYFGPNANRPIIRGLDGDRVRMLSNAGASLDASSLSFDHAVPIDPLIVDRIEVLRGPGALLYGGSAIGGVVNSLDNRIPTQPVKGLSGATEVRLGGADVEKGGAALVETGNGQYALHADVFGRRTSDLHVPTYTPIEDGVPLPRTDRVRNSASDTSGGALGGSLFFERGHIGLSADTYDSKYGAVAEPDVTIKMKRDHVGIAGEWKSPDGPLRALRVQLNDTRYKHEEIEGTGAIGTTFKTSGTEGRVEAEHAPLGAVRGVVGLQGENFDFSALGEEAFVPTTHTKRNALFALEELPWAGGTLTAGARVEHADVNSDGDADPADAKFGPPMSRSFSLHSASLSNVFKLTPQWSLSGSLSYSERAPTSFELYANGVHAATGSFERGDPTLEKERGTNLDVALQWKQGESQWRIGAYVAHFPRFIALEATGNTIDQTDDQGNVESFPEYVFKPVRARLYGFEVDGRQRLVESPWTLDFTGKLDMTRGNDSDTGEPLPRLAPLRALIGLDAASGPWGGRIELSAAARQDRVPATDVPTAGYGLVNLALTRRFRAGASDAIWFLKVDNAGDKLAYSASTVQTVRDLAPLPGRALKAGVRLTF